MELGILKKVPQFSNTIKVKDIIIERKKSKRSHSKDTEVYRFKQACKLVEQRNCAWFLKPEVEEAQTVNLQ